MIRTLARKVIRRHFPKNARLNRLVKPVGTERLVELAGVHVALMDLAKHEHLAWLEAFLPDHTFVSPLFKKPIEFYATYKILQPTAEDVFLDAAGGVYTYLHRISARAKYMQDLTITSDLRQRLGDGIQYLESDAGSIPLPDASVDKISCHHSFEHFEGESDTAFVGELQRLLRPGGRACVLPLFVAEEYFEITSTMSRAKKYDRASRRLRDLTATLPGGNQYARVYDAVALRRRVIDHIDRARFNVSIFEIRMDGQTVPDLALPCNQNVAAINRPFRALIIDRHV